MTKISVVMPVHFCVDLSKLARAIKSVLQQSFAPSEILVVVDGSIGANHKNYLLALSKARLIKLVWLPKNFGPGTARHQGIELASSGIIAVMDSDDISEPFRFQVQVEYLKKHKIDVVGGQIAEFQQNPKHLDRIRRVPLKHDEILKAGKWRNPMNHVTMLFYKRVYKTSGGYPATRHGEDYELFVRMVASGARFANLDQILVRVNMSQTSYIERQGMSYLTQEIRLIKRFHSLGYISKVQLAINVSIRLVIRLLPLPLLAGFYTLLREKRPRSGL